ncbi:MAG: cellulose biosynthesis cyclic di-GMP-binding regulatory protein BcsB, partial [Planctomycetes bacterium]|nr:cellulose biosynthesis cyclic di-GMP-binding regulatory protein BcsB [Planctomycetota bacterium]
MRWLTVHSLMAICFCCCHALAQTEAIRSVALCRDTALLRDGAPECVVVRSDTDPGAATAAERIARGLLAKYGAAFPLVGDSAVCKQRLGPVRQEYRGRNLIVVGSLESNLAVLPLYAQFLCGSDSFYPGGDGYELRTVSSPWGTGRNVIVVGASTQQGLEAAAQAFLAKLPDARDRGALLPHLLEVRPGGEMAKLFQQTIALYERAKPLDPAQDYDVNSFTSPAFHYHWTGDLRWAERARDFIRHLNRRFKDAYLVSDYTFESIYRAWDMVEDA